MSFYMLLLRNLMFLLLLQVSLGSLKVIWGSLSKLYISFEGRYKWIENTSFLLWVVHKIWVGVMPSLLQVWCLEPYLFDASSFFPFLFAFVYISFIFSVVPSISAIHINHKWLFMLPPTLLSIPFLELEVFSWCMVVELTLDLLSWGTRFPDSF